MFKPTSPALGGLLWKIPWRMSRPQKQRLRHRLQNVDNVISTVSQGLQQERITVMPRILQELNDPTRFPTESQMLPRDKYTTFDRKVRGYRKSVHRVPKWTKISQRTNPTNY